MAYSIERMPERISIGRETETGVTDVKIDCGAWISKWPGMTLHAIHTPEGGAPYILQTETDGGVLVWHVTDADTATPGTGLVEIVGETDGRRKVSAMVKVYVAARMGGTVGEPPEAALPWVDRVVGAADRITGMQVQATTLDAGSGATAEWDGEQGLLTIGVPKGKDGKDGADGKDAVVDATLTKSGQAADAKATGEAFGQLKDEKVDKTAIVQTTGDSYTAVMSQKATTDIFDSTMDKTHIESEDFLVKELTIDDFSRRGDTTLGDTALIEVVPSGTYVLSFASCPYDGNGGGLAQLFKSEYNEEQEQTVTDEELYFERLGTAFNKSPMLYSTIFPNGGRLIFTVGETTKYIKLMFNVLFGAPERFPSGLTLTYRAQVVKYGKIKREKLPIHEHGIEDINGKEIVSNNLFNKATATTQKTVYLGKSTSGEALYGWYCAGAVNAVASTVSSTGFDSTSMAIPVSGGEQYYKNSTVIINFFDESDVWLNHPQFSFKAGVLTVPDNAKYARLSFISSEIDMVQFIKGNKYVPYDNYREGINGISIKEYSAMEEVLARHGLEKPYMQEYMWKIAEEAHKYTAPDRHTFLFVADTHAQSMSNRVMSAAASMTKFVPCSYIAHGGDIIDGITEKENELLVLTTLVRNANEAQCPTYYAKGNHDWNGIYKKVNPNASNDEYILNAELASRTNCFNKKNVHGNVEEMYFYIDDEVTKVRTIFINGFNEGKNGSVADLQGKVQIYTQEQLEWFANEALNFSNKADRTEWGVIVIGHQMINSCISSILFNFKNGTSQNVSVTENGEAFIVPVNFTEQGAMDVIAVFAGDNHYDDLVPVSSTYGVAEILILNASLAKDYTDGHQPPSSSALMPPDKVFGTENETAFDIVTIDRTNHLIYMTRYGARSYAYNEETGDYDMIAARTRVVDYATSSYVVCTED